MVADTRRSGGGIETSTRDRRAHRYGAKQIIGPGAPDRRALGPDGPTGYSGRMTAAGHSPFLRCITVVPLLVRSERVRRTDGDDRSSSRAQAKRQLVRHSHCPGSASAPGAHLCALARATMLAVWWWLSEAHG
jgi:hypothetical protein